MCIICIFAELLPFGELLRAFNANFAIHSVLHLQVMCGSVRHINLLISFFHFLREAIIRH